MRQERTEIRFSTQFYLHQHLRLLGRWWVGYHVPPWIEGVGFTPGEKGGYLVGRVPEFYDTPTQRGEA